VAPVTTGTSLTLTRTSTNMTLTAIVLAGLLAMASAQSLPTRTLCQKLCPDCTTPDCKCDDVSTYMHCWNHRMYTCMFSTACNPRQTLGVQPPHYVVPSPPRASTQSQTIEQIVTHVLVCLIAAQLRGARHPARVDKMVFTNTLELRVHGCVRDDFVERGWLVLSRLRAVVFERSTHTLRPSLNPHPRLVGA